MTKWLASMTLIGSSSIITILGVFNDKRKRKLDENLELHIAKLYDILVFETDMMKAKEITSAFFYIEKLATIKNALFHPFM